jgi:hypothetical protein
MRSFTIKAALILALTASARAEGSTLYSTTDLGPGYQLQADAGGRVHGVANSDGSVVYAFDKSPVTPISERIDGGSHAYSFTQYTMENGPFKVGYSYDYGGGLSGTQHYAINYPTFEPWSNGWFVSPGISPVSDINSRGQVVGNSLYWNGGSYAAFSDVNAQSHGFGAAVADNLNTYIATIPGVSLTSAMKIDDLGRIVALGSDGHDYLLTPVGLGPASTVPEPTALMMLGLAGAAVGSRSIRRKSWPGAY